MLLAVLVVDKTGFPLFEYFPNKSFANKIIKDINQLEIKEGYTVINDLNYYFKSFSPEFRLCFVYKDEKLSEDVKLNAGKLGSNIMSSDKVTLRQVLSATQLSEFEALH